MIEPRWIVLDSTHPDFNQAIEIIKAEAIRSAPNNVPSILSLKDGRAIAKVGSSSAAWRNLYRDQAQDSGVMLAYYDKSDHSELSKEIAQVIKEMQQDLMP